MFCSHCGKTVDPAAERCPHCDTLLGNSKLSGHTSVQPIVPSAESDHEEGERYASYTKTTYTSQLNVGEDVYSRTAYRPVLAYDSSAASENPSAQKTAESAVEAEDAVSNETDAAQAAQPVVSEPVETTDATDIPVSGELDDAQKAALRELETVPDDAPEYEEAQRILKDEIGIQSAPLKPITKKGISPEVASYIQRMESMKNRKASKRRDRSDMEEEPESAPQEAPLPDLPTSKTETPDENVSPARERRPGSVKRWIGRILAVLLILAVIVGGVFYLAYVTQPKSQVEGVTSDLFEQGVALIRTRISDDYRKEVVSLYQTGDSAAMMQNIQARKDADRAEIEALMPNNPMPNDQAFINALLSIQEAVDNATATDVLLMMNPNDPSMDLSGEAEKEWSIINNYVLRLEMASKPEDLDIVATGVMDVMATPEPTPAPTPAPYQTLSKGSKGQSVKELQERLRDLGWFQGNIDGKYGTVTRNAIQSFQKASGLEVTGIASSDVLTLIYSDDALTKGASEAVTPSEASPEAVAPTDTSADADGQDVVP